MSIRFYSWPQSSGSRVHWALEELGLPYEYVRLDAKKGEHKAPAYLAVNPNGKVPALVDGGETYFESLAILLHLAERYGVERKLWPASGPARADALSWTVWSTTEMFNYMMQYLYHGLDTPMSYKPDQRSKATAEWNLFNFSAHLDMLEARLRDRPFVLGEFSLADVPIASTLRFGKMMGANLGERPAVAAWLERVGQRPALARAE
jgi:glutathione S-transferase